MASEGSKLALPRPGLEHIHEPVDFFPRVARMQTNAHALLPLFHRRPDDGSHHEPSLLDVMRQLLGFFVGKRHNEGW